MLSMWEQAVWSSSDGRFEGEYTDDNKNGQVSPWNPYPPINSAVASLRVESSCFAGALVQPSFFVGSAQLLIS